MTNAVETISPDDFVKSYVVQSNIDIVFDSTTGTFTSNAGPGYYEIAFGGSWNDNASTLSLYVDGAVYGPAGNLSSTTLSPPGAPTDFVSESIIVHTNAATPTFAIGAVLDPIALVAPVGGVTAFVTIKKIHNN